MEKQIRLGSILEHYAELLRTHTQEEIEASLLSARNTGITKIYQSLANEALWEEIEANLVLGKPKPIKEAE